MLVKSESLFKLAMKLLESCLTILSNLRLTTEIAEQDSSNFMGSLGMYSFFTNIPLEETIEILTNSYLKNNDNFYGLKKTELKNLLFLAAKEFYFIFSNISCKQINSPIN